MKASINADPVPDVKTLASLLDLGPVHVHSFQWCKFGTPPIDLSIRV